MFADWNLLLLISANLLGLLAVTLALRLPRKIHEQGRQLANKIAEAGNKEDLQRLDSRLTAMLQSNLKLGTMVTRLQLTMKQLTDRFVATDRAAVAAMPAAGALSAAQSGARTAADESALYADAMALAKQGMAAKELAARCNITLAEAELVAALAHSSAAPRAAAARQGR